jgi:predicted nucleic acid-binding protein
VRDQRAERDVQIAGTALVHGMNVVTSNVAHFAAVGAPALNPWEAVVQPGSRKVR